MNAPENDSPAAGGDPRWLAWARQLHAVARNGLLYSENAYDKERYEQVLQIAAEMMTVQSGSPDVRPVLDLLKTDTGYITPKVDVRAVIMQDNKMLLVEELMDDRRWTLPGGWADPNDSPAIATERETREETGLEVKATRLLAAYDRSHPRHGHQPPQPLYSYKLFFLCDIVGGQLTQSIETGKSAFFAEDEIPENLSIARISRSQLLRFFEMVRYNVQQADFD